MILLRTCQSLCHPQSGQGVRPPWGGLWLLAHVISVNLVSVPSVVRPPGTCWEAEAGTQRQAFVSSSTDGTAFGKQSPTSQMQLDGPHFRTEGGGRCLQPQGAPCVDKQFAQLSWGCKGCPHLEGGRDPDAGAAAPEAASLRQGLYQQGARAIQMLRSSSPLTLGYS